jgi:hypothetical protein
VIAPVVWLSPGGEMTMIIVVVLVVAILISIAIENGRWEF